VAHAQLANSQAVLSRERIPNPPLVPWRKTEFVVPRTDTPPRIDGTLDDPCWKTALHAYGFFRFQSSEPCHEQTEAWICADRKQLYFAFHCQDSRPELIRTAETQREGDLSHDDYIGIAIDSQGTGRNISQFTVSARGTQQTQLEGGTADNLTWAGNWTAAAHRVTDGWTAEVSIPFSILRYPRGAKSMGIVLIRSIARETNGAVWPYVPPQGNSNPLPFICPFKGIEPPTFAPKLVALPYVLGTAGPTSSFRAGADLKYPVSTTLTGVATLFPDFATVEQAVSDLSFSYTEKYIPDHRPFFLEGNNLLQDSFLFYSQRIPYVDEGLKLVGKQGRTTISALETSSSQAGGQTAVMANAAQDLGLYSQIGGAFLSNDQGGQPSNQVGRLSGAYGYAHGSRVDMVQGNVTGSWLGGGATDHNDWVQISSYAGHGKLGGSAFYTETGSHFMNELGLVPETDLRGTGFNLNKFDNFDRGKLETYSVNLSASTYRHMTDGFFHDDMALSTYFMVRSGLAYEFDLDAGKYFPYVDNTVTSAFYWNQKTLLHRGSISLQVGHREDQPYQFLAVNQGLLVSKPFSIQATLGYERADGTANTQTILTGTYRINGQESIGGRLLQQDGDVDLYLSYGRRVAHGTDVFILVGDPNSARTRGQVVLKLVWPL
jgi:hypothetical protein